MSPLCGAAVLVACAAGALPAAACELVLTGHRDAHPLLRVALPAGTPQFEIRFIHSVLGTPVVDRYEWRGAAARAHLVEERFIGEGYGLPYAAAAGETLQRDGEAWRLRLDRPVQPLVVRPLAAQRMQLRVAGRTWLLADLSREPIEINARACRQ